MFARNGCVDVDINCVHKIETDLKYGLIDNNYLYNHIIDVAKKNNVRFIMSKVHKIDNCNVFLEHNVLTAKIIIDGSGKHGPINSSFIDYTKGITIKKNYSLNSLNSFNNLYKQYFIGIKIKTNPHNIKNVILIDKFVDDSCKTPSFGYIIPYDDTTLLVEETVLVAKYFDTCEYSVLLERLVKRLKNYNITILEQIKVEVDSIPLNNHIPNNRGTHDSHTFPIGQAGNMINNLSGYTLGYNIYHIPEFCDYIVSSNFNKANAIQSYWNNKRRVINYINLVGLKMMYSFDASELNEFQTQYFKYIAGTYNYKIMFLNCDYHNFNWFKLMWSFKNYIYFPSKYLLKIGRFILYDWFKFC